jgi:hypothetical protein
MKAPFTYFGGKSSVAANVWAADNVSLDRFPAHAVTFGGGITRHCSRSDAIDSESQVVVRPCSRLARAPSFGAANHSDSISPFLLVMLAAVLFEVLRLRNKAKVFYRVIQAIAVGVVNRVSFGDLAVVSLPYIAGEQHPRVGLRDFYITSRQRFSIASPSDLGRPYWAYFPVRIVRDKLSVLVSHICIISQALCGGSNKHC